MNNQNMNISQNKKLKNKIVALSQVGNNESEQGTIYETFSNSLYRQLNFYQFHTLNHFFTTITLDHLSQL